LWEKKVKKARLSINEDDLNKFLAEKRLENVGMFYLGIRQEKIDADEIIRMIQDEQKHPAVVVTEEGRLEGLFNKFVISARRYCRWNSAGRETRKLYAQLRQVL